MFANRYIRGVKVPCVAILIVAVIAIVAYGYYLRKTKSRDILETKIIDRKGFEGIDGWGLTHALLYFVMGLMYPGHYVQALALSYLWEMTEDFLGTHPITVGGKRLQLIGDTDADGRPTGNDKAYWFGRISDVAINVTGYILGTAVSEKYWPNDYVRTPIEPRR